MRNIRKESLKTLVREKIRKAKKKNVFLREDFEKLGDYKQVGRALLQLTQQGILIKIGYGLYAKARISSLTNKPMIAAENGFAQVSEEALKRLKVDYKIAPIGSGNDTQVRANAAVIIYDRFSRKIGTDRVKLRTTYE